MDMEKSGFILLLWLMTILSVIDSYSSDKLYDYSRLANQSVNIKSENLLRNARKAAKNGDKQKALVFYSIVCDRSRHSKTRHENELVVDAYLESGKIYYWQGYFAKALSQYVKGLKASEGGSRPHLMELYCCIGNVYFMFNDYEKALMYYRNGLQFKEAYPDRHYAYRLEINMSYACEKLGRLKEAYAHHAAAMRIGSGGDSEDIFLGKYHLALIKEHDKRYKEAINLLKPLIAYSKDKKLPSSYTCSVYEALCGIYDKSGKADSSLIYMNQCIATAEATGQLALFTEMLARQAAIYEKRGDLRRASELRKRCKAIEDSVFNVREFSQAKNTQFLYEMEKIEKEISTLNAEKEQREMKIRYQRIMLFSMLGVVVIVTTLLLLVWRQKCRLNESYRSLFTMNKKVEAIHKQLVEADLKDGRHEDRQQPAGEERKPVRYVTSNLSDDQHQKLIARITAIMETTKEYTNSDFSLDRLATLVDSNSKYVSQVINGNYGKNFSHFVNEYRIRLACQMLSDTERYGNLTIYGVASSVGYNSNTAFVNAFRKVTGMTPSTYKKVAKEEKRSKDEE